jgi:hypothetical protein
LQFRVEFPGALRPDAACKSPNDPLCEIQSYVIPVFFVIPYLLAFCTNGNQAS